MRDFLLKRIDLFYFFFKKILPLKTYRYAVCGGGNMLLDTILYFICFHLIFAYKNVDLYFVSISPHIASLFLVFPITFITGFLMNRYIVFSDSNLSVKTQFFRYFFVGIAALMLSYFSMKLFVDLLNFYPTPSRILTIVITVAFGYIMQTKFSFKVQ